MDRVIHRGVVGEGALARSPAYQAYEILHYGFVAAPALAGADKFFNLLTDWDKYLAPAVLRVLPMSGHAFMLLVGVVELLAAAIVLVKPRIGAWVVAGWLGAIIVNLLLRGAYFDVALRDLGLLLGAIALGRLASVFDVHRPRRVTT